MRVASGTMPSTATRESPDVTLTSPPVPITRLPEGHAAVTVDGPPPSDADANTTSRLGNAVAHTAAAVTVNG